MLVWGGWYLLRKFDFDPAPLVLGLVIAPTFEMSFRQSLIMSNGGWTNLLERPISAGFAVSAGLLILSAVSLVMKRKTGRPSSPRWRRAKAIKGDRREIRRRRLCNSPHWSLSEPCRGPLGAKLPMADHARGLHATGSAPYIVGQLVGQRCRGGLASHRGRDRPGAGGLAQASRGARTARFAAVTLRRQCDAAKSPASMPRDIVPVGASATIPSSCWSTRRCRSEPSRNLAHRANPQGQYVSKRFGNLSHLAGGYSDDDRRRHDACPYRGTPAR